MDASGFLDPEKTVRRIGNLGNPEITPRRQIRSPEVQPYHTKFDLRLACFAFKLLFVNKCKMSRLRIYFFQPLRMI